MHELMNEMAFADVKFSQEVKKGRASIDLKNPAKYLSGVLGTSTKGITDFKYVGYRYLDPFEEFESLLRQGNGKPKSGKIDSDVSNTSIRKVIFEFSYQNRPIYKPLYLLALNNEGTFYVSDTEWYIMPILSDRIIAFFGGKLFFKPLSTKLNVSDEPWGVAKNGLIGDESILYVDKFYTMRSTRNAEFGTPSTPFLLFFLARYGVAHMLKKYERNATFIITDDEKVISKYIADVNFDIYSSVGSKIKRLKFKSAERHNKMVIVNRKSNEFIKMLAVGVLYIFDIFPNLANSYNVNNTADDDILYWKNIVGKLEFKNSLTPTGYVSRMIEFEATLDRYIDNISREKCYDMGYKIDNFWDFIHTSGKVFKKLKTNSISNKFDITEKHLEINYYVMYGIVEGFNKAFANIIKQEKADSISYESVSKIINGDKIKPKLILKIVQSSSKILSSLLVTTSSDNRYFNITAMMDIQERGDGVKKTGKNSNNAFPASLRRLRGAHLYVGSLFGLNKTAPSGLLRLNVFCSVSRTGQIILTPEEKKNCDIIDIVMNHVTNDEATVELIGDMVTTDERVGSD